MPDPPGPDAGSDGSLGGPLAISFLEAPLKFRAPRVAVLAAQMFLARPRLSRRSSAVLAGQDAPRSHAHYAYVALEA